MTARLLIAKQIPGTIHSDFLIMNAQQIRDLVDSGRTVYCDSKSYVVIKDSIGQYLIKCLDNNYCIGLTHQDNTTLNGTYFFAKDDK